jgi:hypothetical protein
MPIDLACALGAGGFAPVRGPEGPEEGKYDRLNAEAANFFKIVSLDEAQVVIFPYKIQEFPEQARLASLEAQKRGLPCYFLTWGDADESLSLPHGIVLRHSIFSDRRLANERAMPAFCSDPLGELGCAASFREKQVVPSVGFCGYVSFALARLMYRLTGRTEKALGLSLRARVLAVLKRSSGIKTDFVTRNAYWAGAAGRKRDDPQGKFQARRQFLDNLLGNDYTVCIRGAGNFSYRLYETLAAGRIPLLINTQCVFPFEEEIDWKAHCVWVEENEIDEVAEILKEFHRKLSPEQFMGLRRGNRELWEGRLSPLGFYRHLLEKGANPS